MKITMKRPVSQIPGLLLLMSVLTLSSQAQRATEKFIPINQSPGLSGEVTVLGKVEQLQLQEQVITVIEAGGESRNITCTEKTRVWLDRSADRKPAQDGALRHCQVGRRVEIKFQDNDPAKPAEWVKVQMTGSD